MSVVRKKLLETHLFRFSYIAIVHLVLYPKYAMEWMKGLCPTNPEHLFLRGLEVKRRVFELPIVSFCLNVSFLDPW